MKNQGDIIALIVAFVVLAGGVLTFYFTSPQPPKPSPPEQVNLTKLELPNTSVVMSNGLPGSGSGSGGSGAGRPGAGGGASPMAGSPGAGRGLPGAPMGGAGGPGNPGMATAPSIGGPSGKPAPGTAVGSG